MVRLLKVQEEETLRESDSEHLKAFGISLLCSILDIFESDLQPGEMKEIEQFCKDWSAK